MNFKITLICALFFLSLGNLSAQDIHNTLFSYNPLHINPANTGAFSGTVRLGGIYRDQARGISNSKAYSTPAFFADAPILMVGKRHWVGVGVMAFQDNAGRLGQKTTSFQLSGAFHLSMDKKSKNVLTLGVQWGQLTRTIDCGAGNFESTIVADETDPICNSNSGGTGMNPNDPEASATDINVGLLLKSKINKTTSFNVGISGRHVNSPSFALDTPGDDGDFKFRFIGHAGLDMELNDKITLEPKMYFTNMASASQFQLQGWGGYKLKPINNKPTKLLFGLGYRIGDAGQFLAGLDWGDLKVALGYDLTLSGLTDVNNGNGGFEIAANYIIKIYKKPVVNPAVICPKL